MQFVYVDNKNSDLCTDISLSLLLLLLLLLLFSLLLLLLLLLFIYLFIYFSLRSGLLIKLNYRMLLQHTTFCTAMIIILIVSIQYRTLV